MLFSFLIVRFIPHSLQCEREYHIGRSREHKKIDMKVCEFEFSYLLKFPTFFILLHMINCSCVTGVAIWQLVL